METCVNYNETPPIKPVSTVAVINSFVISTTRFLNQFAFHCETKISQISRHLTRLGMLTILILWYLETTLSLLELKLDSIPEISGIQGEAALPLTNEPPKAPTEETSLPPPIEEDSYTLPAVQSEQPLETSESSAVPEGMVTNDKNPLYIKYFKLLNLGAIPDQIKRQMAADGFDPNILEYIFYHLFF